MTNRERNDNLRAHVRQMIAAGTLTPHRDTRRPMQPTWNPRFDLDLPLRMTEPWEIAVTLFDDDEPFERTAAVFAVMAASPQHRYTVMVTRPDLAKGWFAWIEQVFQHRYFTIGERAKPAFIKGAVLGGFAHNVAGINPSAGVHTVWPLPNVAIGVTISDQPSADELLPILGQIPAHRRIVRATLRGPVDLRAAMGHHSINGDVVTNGVGVGAQRWQPGIDQVIISAEDGPDATPVEIGWLTTLAGEVLDAQTLGPCDLHHGAPCITGEQVVVAGPSLSIEQWPVCPDCLAKAHPDDNGVTRYCGATCGTCDGTGQSRPAMTARRPEDINPRVAIPGHGTKRYSEGVRWES